MNQLFLGGIVGLAVWLLPYVLCKGRPGLPLLVLLPFFIALPALWAIAPDLPRLFGFHDLYMKLAHDPATDIFFWHYTIDLSETDNPWYGPALWCILNLPVLIAWRELARRERS